MAIRVVYKEKQRDERGYPKLMTFLPNREVVLADSRDPDGVIRFTYLSGAFAGKRLTGAACELLDYDEILQLMNE